MTLTEAIKHYEDVADYDCFTDEQRKRSEEHRQLADWLRELKERREKAQLSGEDATFDCISRQDAINKFERWLKVEGYNRGELNMLKAVLYELRFMPPASTDLSTFSDKLWKIAYERGKAEGRKKGKWIEIKYTFHHKCSNCEWINNADSGYNFCPHCGADMTGGEEE